MSPLHLPLHLIIRQFESPRYYEPIITKMNDTVLSKITDPSRADEIWLLEHHPIFTLGQAGRTEHILVPEKKHHIPIIRSERGGQVTYHGPGQLVAYLILNLSSLSLGVRDLVKKLETAVTETLGIFSIKNAVSISGMPGVFLACDSEHKKSEIKKIASLGLRVKRHTSYHGLALNVNMDLTPFSFINPCGYEHLKMTQIRDYCPSATIASVRQPLVNALIAQLYPTTTLVHFVDEQSPK